MKIPYWYEYVALWKVAILKLYVPLIIMIHIRMGMVSPSPALFWRVSFYRPTVWFIYVCFFFFGGGGGGRNFNYKYFSLIRDWLCVGLFSLVLFSTPFPFCVVFVKGGCVQSSLTISCLAVLSKRPHGNKIPLYFTAAGRQTHNLSVIGITHNPAMFWGNERNAYSSNTNLA